MVVGIKDVFTQGSMTLKNVSQPITEFIRENPVLSGSIIAAGIGGTATAIAVTRSRRKKARRTKRKTVRRKKRKIRRRKSVRRRTTRRRKKRRVIRGRGLGTHEIKHSGRRTKGTKVVSFRTKSGQLVRFKTRGSSKRRRGFKGRR